MIDELQDILDEIVPDTTDSIIHEGEFIATVLQLMEEYTSENIEELMEENFEETFLNEIFELVLSTFGSEIQFYHYGECKEKIEEIAEIFHQTFMPPRSYDNSIILNERVNLREITERLNILRSMPQPDQRTAEWYAFRHNLITASNAYKTLMEGSEYNQIIFEKCKPLYVPGENGSDKEDETIRIVNVDTTLHWGQKYEPLSVLIYEDMYDTQIEDFGCIQHEKYEFLGASPDGINVETRTPRYGRMLEIKNIVNREITGIPKLEYWVQMQLQMETCKLEECDFLETRFVEYESEDSYNNDKENTTGYKGMFMYFSKDGKPTYKYTPLNIMKSKTRVEKWEEKQLSEMEAQGYMWVKNIYWKLEELSCVLVTRNSHWFQSVVPTIEKAWETVIYEREHGFDHRKPTKRSKSNSTSNVLDNPENTINQQRCMITLNKDTGSVGVNTTDVNEVEVIITEDMKIRTESIDETRQKQEN